MYKRLEDSQHGLDIEVQKVSHPSRVHLDIETDDIEAEVRRLEKLGAKTNPSGTYLVGHAGADRTAILRGARAFEIICAARDRLALAPCRRVVAFMSQIGDAFDIVHH